MKKEMKNKRGNSHLYFANNFLIPKSKRSQVTIFIILALAIVFVLILIIIKKPSFGAIITPATPIDTIKQCSLDSLENSTKLIISQGGMAKPDSFYLYNGTKIQYLCYASDYYQKCVMQKPLIKETIENELKNDLTPKILDCINAQKNSLERKGYAVSYKNPNITVQLVPGNILLNIDLNLNIVKDKTETYKSINIDKSSKLYELAMIASSIMNYEARYGKSEIMSYMMYYPDIRVEKKKQSDGTDIYILTDKNTEDQFVFAIRSIVLPVGVTGK